MGKILFRADGNSEIGFGHVMRCLSIADAAKEQGTECRFVVADKVLAATIQNRGFTCDILGTDYRNMKAEKNSFEVLLRQYQPNAIVVDSYFVTGDYLAWLGQFADITYIDDLAAFAYPVKKLVNYNIYAPELGYEKLYHKAGVPIPQLYLGPRYVPLRKQFQNLSFQTPPEIVKNVLVSTGGADPQHIALSLAQYLITWKPASQYVFHFVVGAMNPDLAALQQIANGHDWIELHRNVQNMAALMCRCDLAIAAAGSTLYELCACSVPTVTYTFADNQILGMNAFNKKSLMISAGDIRAMKAPIGVLVDCMMLFIDDWKKRVDLAHNMRNVTVGMGASCLAKVIAGVS